MTFQNTSKYLLLHLTDEEISRTKIRFMTNYNGTEPIKVFRRDRGDDVYLYGRRRKS